MYCKDCVFWERRIDEIYSAVNVYTNQRSECVSNIREEMDNWRDVKHKETIIHNCGACSCPKIDYWIDIKDGDEVSYEDYEGYAASIKMGENFGCIHFKKKDQDELH